MLEDIFEMLEQALLSNRVKGLMEYHIFTPTYLAYCSKEIFSMIQASPVLRQKYKGMGMVVKVVENTESSNKETDIYLTWHGHRLNALEIYTLCG